MKNVKILKMLAIFAVTGMVFSLSFCKKDLETKTVHDTTVVTKKDTVTVTKKDTITVTKTITVHDTTKVYVHDTTYINISGKAVSGLVTYKDYAGATLNAKGAVIILYSGSAVDPNKVVAYTYSDATGKYKFPMLTAGGYYLFAKFNTANQNFKTNDPINGVNFETTPGVAITMGSADLTQNITLSNVASAGTLKIALDTNKTGYTTADGYKYASLESHSKIAFYGYHNQSTPNQQVLQGGFNVFKLTDFAFDEANVAKSMFKGFVLLSSVNTLEPTRDAVTGCVPQTLGLDTAKTSSTTAVFLFPQADTAWFEAAPGKIERYGKGYIAHGTLTAFYKHQGGDTVSPRVTPLKPDTACGYNGPWNTRISKQVDMYFEYSSKVKQEKNIGQPSYTYNYMMTFEGEFSFDKRKDFYVSSTSISDLIKVSTHVTMQGLAKVDY